jgi:hypothetical protein
MTKLYTTRVAFAVAAIGLILGAAPAVGQQADVAGRWRLEVTTDQGITHPTVVFAQDGATLTGDYSSETLGETSVRGSVEGEIVTWSFSANLQGQDIPVRYRGTLAADGTMSGSIDIAGGMMTGSFTASRSDG